MPDSDYILLLLSQERDLESPVPLLLHQSCNIRKELARNPIQLLVHHMLISCVHVLPEQGISFTLF